MSNDLIIKKNSSFPIQKSPIKNINLRKSKFKLTIRKIALPENDNFNEKIAWITASLGFFENIDKNKNASAIFKEIFLANSVGQILTSTTIAQRIGMSRGSTINHLNNLVNAGLIEKGGKYYFTRNRTMQGVIEEIEDDLQHIFYRMKKMAKEIDKETSKVIQMK